MSESTRLLRRPATAGNVAAVDATTLTTNASYNGVWVCPSRSDPLVLPSFGCLIAAAATGAATATAAAAPIITHSLLTPVVISVCRSGRADQNRRLECRYQRVLVE